MYSLIRIAFVYVHSKYLCACVSEHHSKLLPVCACAHSLLQTIVSVLVLHLFALQLQWTLVWAYVYMTCAVYIAICTRTQIYMTCAVYIAVCFKDVCSPVFCMALLLLYSYFLLESMKLSLVLFHHVNIVQFMFWAQGIKGSKKVQWHLMRRAAT